jgi:hypothetical protein
MSTLLLFNQQSLRFSVNIQPCFTLQRKCRLTFPYMVERPWARAVDRLMKERGLKDIELVGKGGITRQGTISAVRNSPRPPKTDTLMRIAAAIQDAQRLKHGVPPQPVPLWEFFVTDEQSALLRQHAAGIAALTKPAEPTPEEKEFALFLKFKEFQAAQDQPHVKKKRA